MKEDCFYGYGIEKKEYIKDIDSHCTHLVHTKSGAEIVLIENEDDNKLFNICFRTPPDDDTGLPHILEHSVLSGSRKFPTKSPLRDYQKKSLATFINALTMPDTTLYPFSTRNDRDFFNLMDIYLDAVFYPLIYQRREIFKQEGHHIELNEPGGKLKYNGIVYNEMKGAYSSPMRILYSSIFSSLFPDTQYKNESGGNPDFITDLTYEQFIAFHRKYYHPSNSVIILYGRFDAGKCLEFIDREYLDGFTEQTPDSRIRNQEPFKEPVEIVREYSVGNEECIENKSFLSTSFVVGNALEPVGCIALSILCELLIGNSDSPLKKALIDSGLGKDVIGFTMPSKKQPFLSVIVKYADSSRYGEFKSVIDQTLSQIAETGFETSRIDAEINALEFSMREIGTSHYPKGLELSFMVLNSFLYGGDPFLYLKFSDIIGEVKKLSRSGLFERMVRESLLENNHRSYVLMEPVRGLSALKNLETQKNLDEIRNACTPEELERLYLDTAALREYHQSGSTDREIEMIPSLELSDVEKNAEKHDTGFHEIQGVKLYHHSTFCNGVTYLKLYFDMGSLPTELLPYVSLLTKVLSEINTENYTLAALTDEIKIRTGGIQFVTNNFRYRFEADKFSSKFIVSVKVLGEKFSSLAGLLHEVLLRTRFDDLKRLREIIREQISRIESAIPRGRYIESIRFYSYLSPSGKYEEMLKGHSFYQFLLDLEKAPDLSSASRKLEEACRVVMNRDHLIVSVTSSGDDFRLFEGTLEEIIHGFDGFPRKKNLFLPPIATKNEGFMIASKVQYVLKGSNINHHGYRYSGDLIVARSVLTMNYLYQKIRIEGGAYGTYILLGRSGDLLFASYRDPELKGTLDIFDGSAQFLQDLDCTRKELEGLIIGTIGKLDRHHPPESKGDMIVSDIICGITFEDRQRIRDEILNTTLEDIRKSAELFKKVLDSDIFCVLGGETMLQNNEALFYRLVRVFN